MKQLIVALPLITGAALFPSAPIVAQVSIGIGIAGPGISLGIHFPVYPRLVRVPGYPVYYAPALEANYFFFDGYFWLFLDDYWYVSSWYDGPWIVVQPYDVPYFILRVPLRYYRAPPSHFRAWPREAPPRWGEYWGPAWERQHPHWDRWDQRAAPAPAPLPDYQRHYSGDRYPRPEAQPSIQDQHYRYQPKDPMVRPPVAPPPRQAPPPGQGKRPEAMPEREARPAPPYPTPSPRFERPAPPPRQERQERPPAPPGMNRPQPSQGDAGRQATPPGAAPHREPPGHDRSRPPPRPEDEGRPDRGRP
jgi:hypothetical protein